MTDPVILITGAGRGIGAAVARRLARPGTSLVLNYARDVAAASALAQEIAQAGARARIVRADVADEAQVLAMFESIDREEGRLSALVNNAGIVAPRSTVAAMSTERIRRVLEVNVLGAMLCAREAVRRMSRAQGGQGGAIVNVGSAAARLGAAGEYVDYAASKGAIDSFTLGLAREVADEGIRVNAVRPGLIATEIHASGGRPDRIAELSSQVPMQRGGEADEVAAAIAWLLGDEASYVTGALLDVSGGR